MSWLPPWLRALGALLRDPFAHANREALGFALIFYGTILGLVGLAALSLWLLLR